ncbi:I78 family peptidase inhibitor [Sphingomonas mesophila]|uniref:I78 family peptidase inhibitor n=1 Tax=Sphingomonas mesophila TaxID=2303576 RepID=UPI000E56B8BE|nr:I78 family peptidase inhibitor [Sphingomonas mesophila]
MHRLTPLLLGIAPLTLAACATQAQPSAGTGLCAPNGLERFVGKTRSETLAAEIKRQSGATTLRWVPEGTMVTMDFRGERVTVHLDRANRVERVVCG